MSWSDTYDLLRANQGKRFTVREIAVGTGVSSGSVSMSLKNRVGMYSEIGKSYEKNKMGRPVAVYMCELITEVD